MSRSSAEACAPSARTTEQTIAPRAPDMPGLRMDKGGRIGSSLLDRFDEHPQRFEVVLRHLRRRAVDIEVAERIDREPYLAVAEQRMVRGEDCLRVAVCVSVA